jgi:phenylalanyl-tRNA synthetase beta chain
MMTYSFENPKVFDKLNVPPDNDMRNAIEISNPLNDDYKIMRTTTANAIISALATNQTTFRNESASLFEIAKTYTAEKLPLETQPKEEKWLTFGLYDKKADFYMIKGDVESILEHFGEKAEFLPENTLPFMHPGRTAKVVINKKEVGFVGEVHPAVLQNYGFSERAYIAILAFDVLLANVVASPKYKPAPRFPAVKRDIALLAKNSVLSAEIESAVIQKGGKILEEVSLFDVYKGAGVPEGEKSLAYSLVFRASDRTLTDAEVNAALEKILASVKEKTGAALRE